MQNMDVLDHLHQIGVPTVSEAKRKFKKLLRRPIIWMRCHKLKFQKQLIEQQKYQKDVKVLADYVKDFDREGIIKYITNRIHFRDIIIKVVVSIIYCYSLGYHWLWRYYNSRDIRNCKNK